MSLVRPCQGAFRLALQRFVVVARGGQLFGPQWTSVIGSGLDFFFLSSLRPAMDVSHQFSSEVRLDVILAHVAALDCSSLVVVFDCSLPVWAWLRRRRTSVALGMGSILRSTMNLAVNFARFNSHCGSTKT
jgi:hypothetical protein